MQYIILDLEFNQPFDFPTGRKTVLNPSCPFEIIQIGAVKLNESFDITAKANFFVKPQIYRRMHPYVEKITSINNRLLKKAPPFKTIFADFMNFIGNEKTIFGVWGPSDISILFRNITFYGLNIEELPRDYVDVQALASTHLNIPRDRSVSLKSAAAELQVEVNAPFHDALNDAVYTAHIFKRVSGGNVVASTFNPNSLMQKELATQLHVNSKLLFEFAEKEISRPLSDSEKEMVLNVYGAGKKQLFKKR